MRKWLGIIIIALYGILSTGMTLHLHYCHGHLKHVGITDHTPGCCKKEKADTACEGIHASCCNNENIVFDLESDHTAAQHFFIDFPLFLEKSGCFIPDAVSISQEKIFTPAVESRPPPEQPRFILYSSLILYA